MECPKPLLSLRYRVGSYAFEIMLLESERYCLARQGEEIVFGTSAETLNRDIHESALGETIAPFVLLKPLDVVGDKSLAEKLFCEYYLRILVEEYSGLKKIFQRNAERLLVSAIYPIVARISRLQTIYTWFKIVFSEYLRDNEYYSWLHGMIYNCLREEGFEQFPRLIPLGSLLHLLQDRKSAEKKISTRIATMTRIATELASPSIIQAIPGSLLIESISYKPHPLLRDPLLLTRLDAAHVATKLLDFYEQLYALTGLSKLIKKNKPMTKRAGLVRSAVTLEVNGIRPAVVKRYRDITAFKWIVAVILSLPLPKPILGTRARLNNEYYYNRLLSELGYNVPKPILVDPRRRIAAYTYIDGEDLSIILQEGSDTGSLFYSLGEILASLHRDGVSLWDTNPSNFIYDGKNLYLVDLEQAREARTVSEKAFDIAVALYYSLLYNTKNPAERAESLVKGYMDAGGDRDAVIEAAKYKYMAPFMTTIPPNILEKMRKALLHSALGPQEL